MTRSILKVLCSIACAAWASTAAAHGILLSENQSGGVPTSFTLSSQDAVLDSSGTPSPYPNLFLGKFSSTTKADSLYTEGSVVSTPRSTPGTYYTANDGAAATSGPFSLYDSATFTIISPLLYSNGGAAVPAPAGVSLSIIERFPGNAPNGASNQTNHAGAASTADGIVTINGTTGFLHAFNVSLLDSHELAKDLTLGGSTATGAYGFAYTVTVKYHNGPTITSDPMVDIFALTDTTLTGGDFTAAALATQQAASLAIFNAAVPEPSGLLLAGIGAAVAGVVGARKYRRRTVPQTK